MRCSSALSARTTTSLRAGPVCHSCRKLAILGVGMALDDVGAHFRPIDSGPPVRSTEHIACDNLIRECFRCNCAPCGGWPSPFSCVLGLAGRFIQHCRGRERGFNPALPLTHVDNGPNSAWAQSQHYLVLVSLDGFRWDYAKRDNATHLLALGKAGRLGARRDVAQLSRRSHFPITSPSSPAFIPSITAWSPTAFSDPARGARYSMYRPAGRDRRLVVQRRSLMEPG